MEKFVCNHCQSKMIGNVCPYSDKKTSYCNGGK